MDYKLSDFDFELPEELIATKPASPRDHSRLLVLDKKTGKMEHQHFFDIVDYLNPGDILVVNNSKVIPARLWARKRQSPRGETLPEQLGGKVEVLLHKKLGRQSPCEETLPGHDIWQCLLGGRVSEGLELRFLASSQTHPGLSATPLDRGDLTAKVLKNNNDGTWDIEFNKSGADFMSAVEQIGEVPLPPYIINQRKKEKTLPALRAPLQRRGLDNSPLERGGAERRGVSCASNDKENYQTVYAADDKKGSVAVPTAGLHFTPELLKKIKNKGVEILEITLYVGMGTFAPVKTENILEHKMHAEWVEINQLTIKNLQLAIKENKKIIAVGTTSARALEACWQKIEDPLQTPHLASPCKGEGQHEDPLQLPLAKGEGALPLLAKERVGVRSDFKAWVDIFIYPGYEFKIVDALITNFHLPKSTLLMLVSALTGKENIDRAYAEAIARKYRFYSYGDAMFIK